jgi:hypothetical protein
MTYLKVKVCIHSTFCKPTYKPRVVVRIMFFLCQVPPSPVPVKEESEECSHQPVDEEEVALITVKKEENEDWLKSEDEDVVKVSVPWELLETSPSSSCSDTEDSEMESDNVQVSSSM